MSRFGAGFAVICLLVFLTGQTTASFWRPVRPTLPSDPKDKFYEAFQAVPPLQVTAKKLMTNFLHINPDPAGRRKRQTIYEDIVVVIDGSGSVGTCEFNKGKKALEHTIQLAQNSPEYDTKYAAVTFATSATVNFKFLPYALAAKEIMKIGYPNGWTNTQAGLEEAMKLFMDPTSGGRQFGRRTVLVFTDGQSNVKQDLTIPKADILKRMGVQINVVAVGSYIDGIDEMVKVASSPPQDFIYRVKKNSDFLEVIKLIIKQVAPGKYDIVNYEPPC